MTLPEIDHFISCLTHLKSGGTCQYYDSKTWIDVTLEHFSIYHIFNAKIRIKPSPLKLWVFRFKTGSVGTHWQISHSKPPWPEHEIEIKEMIESNPLT